MKPIAIFRHSPGEGPGYFATFLDRHSLPWTLFRVDHGVSPPPTSEEFSGLCFMGGPMSVNDDLPWIPLTLQLIRQADAAGVPVIGHCLGGQLMARAFGGTVGRNRVMEIGWGNVEATDAAADWMGGVQRFEAFHWHGETFTLPPGATRILQSVHCANQAFVRGPHLGLQCHVEMTDSMIRNWCRQWAAEKVPPSASASVQTPEQMEENMEARIAAMRVVADRLYEKWIGGLDS